MDCVNTPRDSLAATAAHGLKIVIAGGFGVGKTTFVGAISEIPPLRSEAEMTLASLHVDDIAAVPHKHETTVGLDFGRLTLDEELVLYLFGLPGQLRFDFLWEHLFVGALGAVVLIDTRRLSDSFAPIDRIEASGMPYLVAHNVFDNEDQHALGAIRDALKLPQSVPLLRCDARDQLSVRHVLTKLTHHVSQHVTRLALETGS